MLISDAVRAYEKFETTNRHTNNVTVPLRRPMLALLFVSCSFIVALGQELSHNQSSTTCPGDVVQCECQVSSDTPLLQWLARDLQSEEDVLIATYSFLSGIGGPTSSGPYTTILCSTTTSGSAITLTSTLTVALTNTVDVTCRNSGVENSNTTRLTVAGKYISVLNHRYTYIYISCRASFTSYQFKYHYQ